MSIEDLRAALKDNEELEYHCMGMEQGAALIGGPGWYPCVVTGIYANGNIEVSFTDIALLDEGIGCTVLNRNISIAFRQKQAQEVEA